MKILRQILFVFAMTAAFALTASAQRPDDRKKPPKENAEIKPEEGKKPRNPENNNNNNNNNRPKKPQSFAMPNIGRPFVSSN